MDEVRRFCVRMLGDGPAAREAEQEARRASDGERIAGLRAAVAACRESEPDQSAGAEAEGLAHAIAQELAEACAGLPVPQREVLALRELLGLPYDEIADVTGSELEDVALLLGRARLGLRAQLRGSAATQPSCDESQRGLVTMGLRQDGQPVASTDDEWLMEHLGHCRSCGQAHAAMLEASACYRAWSSEDGAPAS
jgi:hypothetical protein